MKNIILLFCIGALSVLSSRAQKFDVSFHGYVGVNATVDSRSSIAARNGHIYLYPLPKDLNESGEDLNNRRQFDIDASYSRFGLDVVGPELSGFNTSAMIEGDFVGNGEVDSYFRLRHAFVEFSKEKWSLLGGQTWHPVFVPENFPGTVNVNAGVPFHPLIRNPQIRLTWRANSNISLLFFVINQNNFRSTGFNPKGSEEGMLPEFDVQLKWSGGGAFAALTAGHKTLGIPLDIDFTDSPKKVYSQHYSASFRYNFPGVTVKMGGIYGGNLSEMVMLGGVGQSVADDDFIPIEAGSLWTDVHTNNSDGWQPGLFAGYTTVLGAREEILVFPELSRSEGKVEAVYGVSPRLKYIVGNAWIGAEYLFTMASWGNLYGNYGIPENTGDYINHRLLLSLRYNF